MIQYILYQDDAIVPLSRCYDIDAACYLFEKHKKHLRDGSSIRLYEMNTDKDKPISLKFYRKTA